MIHIHHKTFMKNAIFLLLILLGVASCKKSSINISEIQQINYGMYGEGVGYCQTGYCQNELALDSGKVIFKRSSGNNTQELTCEKSQSKSVLDSLSKKISVGDFFRMQEHLGINERAEWIELILRSGEKHKVTFEYLNAPSSLASIVPHLRFMLNKTPCMTTIQNVK